MKNKLLNNFFNIIFVITITLNANNIVLADSKSVGKGELKLSDHSVEGLKIYNEGRIVKGKREKPLVFVISSDGTWSGWSYCPYTECRMIIHNDVIKDCERDTGIKCGVFAYRRTVYWDNEINEKSNRLKLKKKWDLKRLKSELTSSGFYDDGETITKKKKKMKKIKKKKKKMNDDIIDQLNKLNDLYKSGALTKEEFEKAKKKILN